MYINKYKMIIYIKYRNLKYKIQKKLLISNNVYQNSERLKIILYIYYKMLKILTKYFNL